VSVRSILSALLAGALTALVATPLVRTDLGALAWACVPMAVVVALWIARLPRPSLGWGNVVARAVTFGLVVALGGVVLYLVIAMGSALLPGSTVARPEGPVGYLMFFAISVVSLTPFVAIVTSLIGLVWAGVVHLAGHRPEPSRA
jgi:hypothetical protein